MTTEDRAGTFETAAALAAAFLGPLVAELRDGGALGLLEELGYRFPAELLADAAWIAEIQSIADAGVQLGLVTKRMTRASNADDFVEMLAAARELVDTLRALTAGVHSLRDALAAVASSLDGFTREEIDAFVADLPERLLTYSLVRVLDESVPVVSDVFELGGIIERTEERVGSTDPARPQFTRVTLDLARLPRLVTATEALATELYGWGTPSFDGVAMFTKLASVLSRHGFPAFVDRARTPATLDLVVAEARAVDGALELQPRVRLGGRFQLTDDTGLRAEAVVHLRAGSGAVVTLAPDWTLRATAPTHATLDGELRLRMQFAAPAADAPVIVLGAQGGSRLETRSAGFELGSSLVWDAAQAAAVGSVEFAAEIAEAAIVISGKDSDGFIANILPNGELRAEFALKLVASHERGLTFAGEAGLEATIPVGLSVLGVTLSSVTLRIEARDSGFTAEASGSIEASIGPVAFVVDRTGVVATLGFPRTGGNLGVAQLDFHWKPPSGVGVSIDAAPLSGGGLLSHDDSRALYSGALQLSLHEAITLKAFGLIATRLADGTRGYSLVVFITAEDFRPIPLGLGFTLLGVGGMVGVHRTFDVDVLRGQLQNGTLATLLFPRDPIGDAASLIRTLDRTFPARRGSHCFGLLAKIGWFTPTLVLLDLALILELGARKRLLALGRVSALLPSVDNDLVRLQLDALGVIDFDAGTVELDAVLTDSRLAQKFAITGSAALRASFGAGPGFVLSIGGLNPHFAPPVALPTLDRVAIALSSGKNPRLACEAYFAITANTLQFGANASLYASAIGFSIQGDIGFDVLVQIRPLHFIADYHARLQLKRGSHNLFMVSVAGELEGPRPLRLSGKAKFEILWCDFTVRFDTTLVGGEAPPPPEVVDVRAQLIEALASPSSWTTLRTAAAPHGVALRALAPADSNAPLVLDPLGQIAVEQHVVPLDTLREIDTYGGAPVAGDRRFALTASLSGAPLERSPLSAAFAPSQFFSMTDDEKLAAPSFETMAAGGVFGSSASSFDAAQSIVARLDYQTIVLAPPPAEFESTPVGTLLDRTLTASRLELVSRSGAAARAPVHHTGRARFRNASAQPVARLEPERWTVMPNGDGVAAPVPPSVRSWSDYDAIRKTLNRGGARWQLLPVHELED